MANVAQISIIGWCPYDIPGNSDALAAWMARMAGPSFGFNIHYGHQGKGPLNEHCGRMTYYRFEVSGAEAMWASGVERLVAALVDGGCIVEHAEMMDLDFGGGSSRVPIPEHDQPEIG